MICVAIHRGGWDWYIEDGNFRPGLKSKDLRFKYICIKGLKSPTSGCRTLRYSSPHRPPPPPSMQSHSPLCIAVCMVECYWSRVASCLILAITCDKHNENKEKSTRKRLSVHCLNKRGRKQAKLHICLKLWLLSKSGASETSCNI